jgi:DNA-binding transcriptional LysR family regulator
MDLLQIEYFLAVARTENMTAAANSLHVAQSSVSRCIARLEESLGVPLFERNGRGIVLSDYGRAFYTRAETIMRELTDGQQEIKEMRDQHVGRVSISTSAARQINQLMIQYMEEHPNVLFRQRRVYDTEQVKALLDRGTLDYALTFEPLPAGEYDWTPLIKEQYYLLVSVTHPFANKETITLKELNQQRIILNDSDSPEYIDQQMQTQGINQAFAFIGNEYEVLGSMVERNAGVAMISTLGLYDLRKNLPIQMVSRIRVLSIEDTCLHRTLGIAGSKRHYTSQAAREFYGQLVSYFKMVNVEMGY